jgi:hypothetical protein
MVLLRSWSLKRVRALARGGRALRAVRSGCGRDHKRPNYIGYRRAYPHVAAAATAEVGGMGFSSTNVLPPAIAQIRTRRERVFCGTKLQTLTMLRSSNIRPLMLKD